MLDFPHHVHAVDDFPEHHMLVVQKGGGDGGDEELAAVGVGAGVLRGEKGGGRWLVLVCAGLRTGEERGLG